MSRTIPFTKLHGAGNDVVVIDCLESDPVEALGSDWDWERFARFALHRRFGVGGDQLLILRRSASGAGDFFMGVRNPDGSTAEMCANGIRAFYKYLRDKGHTDRDEIRVDSLAGVVTPRWLGDGRVEVEMTPPVLVPEKIPTALGRDRSERGPLVAVPLEVKGQTFSVTPVSMGNPHCVIFVDDPDAFPVEQIGPVIEHHEAFPARTNVEFVAVRSRSKLYQRTWERGTGETLACGSGACATTVAAVLGGHTDREIEIELRGGTLQMRWPETPGSAEPGPVFMTGPATHVFDGELCVP